MLLNAAKQQDCNCYSLGVIKEKSTEKGVKLPHSLSHPD